MVSRAVVSLTRPRRVSRKDPIGIWRASLSGTKRLPFSPGTEAAARTPPLALSVAPRGRDT